MGRAVRADPRPPGAGHRPAVRHLNLDRVAHDAELQEIIEEALAALPPDEASARLDAAGIANARLRTPEYLAGHPQLAARDRWREVATPAARCAPSSRRSPCPAGRPRWSVPSRGQHTAAILAELGLTSTA